VYFSQIAKTVEICRSRNLSVRYLDLDTIESNVAPTGNFRHYRISGPIPAPRPDAALSTPSPIADDAPDAQPVRHRTGMAPATKRRKMLRPGAGSRPPLTNAPGRRAQANDDSTLGARFIAPNTYLPLAFIVRASTVAQAPGSSKNTVTILSGQTGA